MMLLLLPRWRLRGGLLIHAALARGVPALRGD